MNCPDQKNADWDFELVSPSGFGEAHAKLLAEKMGGKGKYAVYVGSLTVPLHNAWADAAIAYLKKNYPDMKLVGDRYGVAENVDDSRKTALDLIAANPDLNGFLAFGSQGPIGAGRALEEKKLGDKVFACRFVLARPGQRMLKAGTIDGGFMWNPMEAGKVFVTLGRLSGERRRGQGRHDDRGPRRRPSRLQNRHTSSSTLCSRSPWKRSTVLRRWASDGGPCSQCAGQQTRVPARSHPSAFPNRACTMSFCRIYDAGPRRRCCRSATSA